MVRSSQKSDPVFSHFDLLSEAHNKNERKRGTKETPRRFEHNKKRNSCGGYEIDPRYTDLGTARDKAATGDLHLAAIATAAIDKAAAHPSVATDYDAEPRPQGAAPDIGADEFSLASQAPEAPTKIRVIPQLTAVSRRHHHHCTRLAIRVWTIK